MPKSEAGVGEAATLTQSSDGLVTAVAEERVSVAGQWQLIWWRFRKHRLALAGTAVVVVFYLIALGADFLAYADPSDSDANRSLMPPQAIHWFADGKWSPHVYAIKGERDFKTMQRVYTLDPNQPIPLQIPGHGFKYKLFGLFPTDVHLFGVEDTSGGATLFVLGSDDQGRDLWSRLMYGTRLSLTIGLLSVALSLFLGILLGGISGYYGGTVDIVIQRVIEVLRSIPTIPLWMGLAAAMPMNWPVTRVYFAITLIISLIGWTDMARVVRGRFLSLREEDFVTAAELAGANQVRIIFRHMVPAFTSHIIASSTLSLPSMILSETALSFLGVGLRPPAISWGVLLQNAQNIQALAITPWLLVPTLPVIVVILAFNFMGDGLRDAADPYSD